MPPRRLGAKTSQKHELEAFAEKYDTLALVYGDPVEVVFSIMAANVRVVLDERGNPVRVGDDEVALRAAEMLMNYRYPRVKASEGQGTKPPVLNFNVTMPHPELPVNPLPQRLMQPPVLVSVKENPGE